MTRKLLSLFVFFLLLSLPLKAATVQFTAKQDIQTSAQHLTGLAVADFNGDGFPDIAVTDDYANQVTVYLNDGHGNFTKSVVTTLTATGYAGLGYLVSGDVNEDGKQDLIVAPIGGLQYDIVLLGNGDGTFAQGQILNSTYGFQNAQLIDINGDKHLDLVSGGNPNILVELGDGKGNFTNSPLPTTGAPQYFNTGLAVGDFNGDHIPDLLTSAYSTFYLPFYSGVGDGTFQVPTDITPAPNFLGTSGANLAAADFNGDGKLDVLLGESYLAIILLGNGDGTFQDGPNQIYGPNLPYAPAVANSVAPLLAAADMDASGTPDIVAADDNAALLTVFLNDGTGKFPQASPDFSAPIDAGTSQLRVADLNGDGLPDIILTNYKTQQVEIFLSVVPQTTPAVSLSSSAAQALVGSSVVISVQVKSSGAHMPTGTVTLSNGSISLGQQTLDANGQATFALSSLAAGQYSLTAAYTGDKYNTSATNSTAFSEAITDFQLAVSTGTQSVAVGGTATYNVSLTPIAGLSGSVTLTCSGLPSAYQCAPTSAALAGQPITVSLAVTPTQTALLNQPPYPQDPSKVAFATFGLACLCLCFRRPRRFALLAALLSILGATQLTGCSNSAKSGPPPYTGTSNFTITASTTQGAIAVSHQSTATLTVHQ